MALELLDQIVDFFLKQRKKDEFPLLIGFSGGSDSLILAHSLFKLGYPIHLAHFDHGWREESQLEAQKCQEWAKQREIPFHTTRSQNPKRTELSARDERYVFFQSLWESRQYSALVLGHHSLDQAETVLKRIFETAHLVNCKGMSPQSTHGPMLIWRPMLSISKQLIHEYQEKEGLVPNEDKSNLDSKYLRGRMRTEIFPLLEESFQKSITAPLLQLADRSRHLDDYLAKKCASIKEISGPFGDMWDFANDHLVEIEYLLQKRFALPITILNQVIDAIEKGEANRKVVWKNRYFVVDRGRFFYLQRPIPTFPTLKTPVNLSNRDWESPGWRWSFSLSQKKQEKDSNWESWWKGEVTLSIPQKKFSFAHPDRFCRERWNQLKVPAFLRDTLPVLQGSEGQIVDFLTGSHCNEGQSVTVSLTPF